MNKILFETSPSHYSHWKLDVKGKTAWLTMNVNEDKGIFDGYKLKLNSYDLGVISIVSIASATLITYLFFGQSLFDRQLLLVYYKEWVYWDIALIFWVL